MKNSANSPHSKGVSIWAEFAAVGLGLALLFLIAAHWFWQHGYLLYYGDAQAHLNISRQLIDSLTPGYDELGTVWLPVPHLLCLPFAANMHLWSNGLAGTIPVGCCFLSGGLFLYASAREAFASASAAVTVIGLFAFNPNMLYLASIPMTEAVFFAGLSAAFYAVVRFPARPSVRLLTLLVIASWWMSLTRYDGWFLIPGIAIALFLLTRDHALRWSLSFALLASLAPLAWIMHNRWLTGDGLDFFRGPYSALAIQGNHYYPGFHDWWLAARYYAADGRWCLGTLLLVFAILGTLAVIKDRRLRIFVAFLLLTPCFYIWSMHSSGNPIFMPQLWPHSYYNTRYGLALLPWAAFSSGALVNSLPAVWQRYAFVIPCLIGLWWLRPPSPENWICWKESQVNYVARGAWTHAAAGYLERNYRPGDGVLAWFGDLTGIFGEAKIPLRENLSQNNGPRWEITVARPDLLHEPHWAISREGDLVYQSLKRADPQERLYRCVQEIHVKDAPTVRIYQRR